MAPKEDPLPPGWENLDRSVVLNTPLSLKYTLHTCLIQFYLVSTVICSFPLSF
jgi:hypothetical protein